MEKLLKVEQVSDLLQVSKRTIYDWTHVGYIPHYKFPNGIRFRESEVERWLKKCRQSGRMWYRIPSLNSEVSLKYQEVGYLV